MANPWYIAAEKARLERCLPEGVRLRWILSSQTYQLTYLPSGQKERVVLREIPRATIEKWRRADKEKVMSYAARRALHDANLPAEFRVKEE